MSLPSFSELRGADPHEILGVSQQAGRHEIRSAQRRLLRRHHPDLPGGDLEHAKMITAAARILLDPIVRAEYERARPPAPPEQHFSASPEQHFSASPEQHFSASPEQRASARAASVTAIFQAGSPGRAARRFRARAAGADRRGGAPVETDRRPGGGVETDRRPADGRAPDRDDRHAPHRHSAYPAADRHAGGQHWADPPAGWPPADDPPAGAPFTGDPSTGAHALPDEDPDPVVQRLVDAARQSARGGRTRDRTTHARTGGDGAGQPPATEGRLRQHLRVLWRVVEEYLDRTVPRAVPLLPTVPRQARIAGAVVGGVLTVMALLAFRTHAPVVLALFVLETILVAVLATIVSAAAAQTVSDSESAAERAREALVRIAKPTVRVDVYADNDDPSVAIGGIGPANGRSLRDLSVIWHLREGSRRIDSVSELHPTDDGTGAPYPHQISLGQWAGSAAETVEKVVIEYSDAARLMRWRLTRRFFSADDWQAEGGQAHPYRRALETEEPIG